MRKNTLVISSLVFSGALIVGSGIGWPQTSTGIGSSVTSKDHGSGIEMSRNSSMSGPESQADVRQVQEALQSKGHNPGPVDGVMGRRTHNALRAFQRSQNISVNGQADTATTSALGITLASSINSAGNRSKEGTGSLESKGGSDALAAGSSGTETTGRSAGEKGSSATSSPTGRGSSTGTSVVKEGTGPDSPEGKK